MIQMTTQTRFGGVQERLTLNREISFWVEKRTYSNSRNSRWDAVRDVFASTLCILPYMRWNSNTGTLTSQASIRHHFMSPQRSSCSLLARQVQFMKGSGTDSE